MRQEKCLNAFMILERILLNGFKISRINLTIERASKYWNPRGPEVGTYHIIRGDAWKRMGDYLRSASRDGYNDASDFYGIGCRCAKSVNRLKLRK